MLRYLCPACASSGNARTRRTSASRKKLPIRAMSTASPSPPLPAPKTKRGERTRQKILDAAEREIGRKGFAEASISTITAEAAVGQGTFYLYFRSKEDVLRELVLRMGRRLRRHLTLAVADAPSRLEAERRGLRAFLEFVRANPDLYRVVGRVPVRRPGRSSAATTRSSPRAIAPACWPPKPEARSAPATPRSAPGR